MRKGWISDKPISGERAGACPSSIRKPHGYFWLIILTSVVFTATATAGQRISKVRAGEHEDFARLVFDMEGPTQVGDPQVSSGRIWLSFLGTETELSKTQLLAGTIRSVEFVSEGQNLNAEIEVAVGKFEINLFALTNPDRIVLDVFPERQASAFSVSEREEVEPAKGRPAIPSDNERANSHRVGIGTTGEPDLESPPGALNANSRSLETEPGKVLSAGFNWALAGLVSLGLFLIGLLSVACMKVVKKTELTLKTREPGEDFRRSVAEVDTLIKEEIRNYDRLKWRNQE